MVLAFSLTPHAKTIREYILADKKDGIKNESSGSETVEKTGASATDKAKKKKQLDRQYLQIPMEEWTIQKWDELATLRGFTYKKALLETLIEEYIQEKASFQFHSGTPPKHIVAYISAMGAKHRSIWLSTDVYKQAEKFADSVPIKVNRVVYSVLIHGLLKANLIEI